MSQFFSKLELLFSAINLYEWLTATSNQNVVFHWRVATAGTLKFVNVIGS